MSTVNYSDRLLHILRNPFGFTDDQVREARLWAGDQIERLWALLKAHDALAAENAALREREQQLQRALAFWHPGVRVDDVPEAATKRAADDACLLYGLEEADEQGAADLGWVAWVAPGEFARLRARLAEATELLARAEDDLSEWERVYETNPDTTRLRLEIMAFGAADSASGEGEK